MNYYDEIAEIKSVLQQKIRHPYLMKFIHLDKVEDEKLELLYFILKETNLPFQTIKNYVVTTMLVQTALDAHESVSLSLEMDNEFTHKNRQLTVLAGDYYSGLYYHILAECEDIPMIQRLAEAIKIINENKISIYLKDCQNLEQFLNGIKRIDSLLIQKVAEHVQFSKMKNLIAELLLLNKLVKEKHQLIETGTSGILDKLNNNGIESDSTSSHFFDLHIQSIKKNINKLMVFPMSKWLEKCIQDILAQDNKWEKVVEEG